MKAIDLIRWAMQMTREGTATIVADMRDDALAQPTARGGNHALWTLGHLAYIEGTLPKILLGEANPVEHWAPLFAPGTQPQTDPSVYPSFDEVLATYHDLRAKNLKLLDEIGDDGLDRAPANVPSGFEDAMTTIGHTLLLFTLHNMVHYGEVAVARRAVGRKPLL